LQLRFEVHENKQVVSCSQQVLIKEPEQLTMNDTTAVLLLIARKKQEYK